MKTLIVATLVASAALLVRAHAQTYYDNGRIIQQQRDGTMIDPYGGNQVYRNQPDGNGGAIIQNRNGNMYHATPNGGGGYFVQPCYNCRRQP